MSSEAPPSQPRPIDEDFNLVDLLVFLFRNWKWAAAAALVLGIIAYLSFESGEIQYEASATCLVSDNPKLSFNPAIAQRVAESGSLANRVREKLKSKGIVDAKKALPGIHAKIQDGRALIVSVAAETPELAASVANEAVQALTEISQSLKTEMIDSAQNRYSRELPSLQKQLQDAETHRGEMAAEFAKKMQTVYQTWRVESSKVDEGALTTASILQKETMDLLQAYQADTFQKMRSLEESLKIEFLRTQVAAQNGKTSVLRMPREGYNAIFAAGSFPAGRPRETAHVSTAQSTWPKSKSGSTKPGEGHTTIPEEKPAVATVDESELQNQTGEFLASLSGDLNALKPEVAFELVPLDNLTRTDLAKAVSELAQAESVLRKLQSERELGFIKLRQERGSKLERLKQETESKQRDLLFGRDQELAGLRFAQENADELALADLVAKRDFLNDLAKANNTATITKAENGGSDVQIIDVAMPPLRPQQKTSVKYALAAMALGVVLGYFVAAIREISIISRKRSA